MNPRGLTGVGERKATVRAEEYELLKQLVLFSDDDARLLRCAMRTLVDRSDDYLDILLGLMAASPAAQGAMSEDLPGDTTESLQTMRLWFREWITETCGGRYDLEWARRVHDAGSRAAPEAGISWLWQRGGITAARRRTAFVYPLAQPVRLILAADGRDTQALDRTCNAWLKSLLLQAALRR